MVALLCVLRLQVAAMQTMNGYCRRIRGCCETNVSVRGSPALKPTDRAGKKEELLLSHGKNWGAISTGNLLHKELLSGYLQYRILVCKIKYLKPLVYA